MPRLVRNLASLMLTSLLLASLAHAAKARERDKKSPPPSWRGTLQVEHAFTDGIEAGSPTMRTDDLFTTIQGSFLLDNRWARSLPLQATCAARARFFNTAHRYDYVEIHPELGYRWGKTDVVAEYSLTPRRLLFAQEEDNAEDATYEENIIELSLRNKLGPTKRLRTRFGGGYENRDFAQGHGGRSSDSELLFGDVRYLLRPWLMPRLDVELVRREAHDTNYDRDEVEIGLGAEIALPYRQNLRLLFSQSWRHYTVADAEGPNGANDNYGRDDLIREYEVWWTIPVPWLADLALQARYKYRTDDSSRAGRSFGFNEVGLSLIYAHGGLLPI